VGFVGGTCEQLRRYSLGTDRGLLLTHPHTDTIIIIMIMMMIIIIIISKSFRKYMSYMRGNHEVKEL
jgi:hypothetical protein